MERARPVEEVGDRVRIRGLVALTPAEQAVVGVERQSGLLVEHAGLRDVQVKCGQALLEQVDHQSPAAEADAGVQGRHRALGEEAEHLGRAVVGHLHAHDPGRRTAQPLGERADAAGARLDPEPVAPEPPAAHVGHDLDRLPGDVRPHVPLHLERLAGHGDGVAAHEEGAVQVEMGLRGNRGGGAGRERVTGAQPQRQRRGGQGDWEEGATHGAGSKPVGQAARERRALNGPVTTAMTSHEATIRPPMASTLQCS
jgi:hypothetical protein